MYRPQWEHGEWNALICGRKVNILESTSSRFIRVLENPG